MSQLYRQIIIDRFKNPRFRGEIPDADIVHGDENVSCGDKLTFYIKLNNNKEISDIKYEGKGCTISLASADLLAEALQDMNLDKIIELDNDFIMDLLGITITPTRTKCAILGLKVIQAGLNIYNEIEKEDTKSVSNERKKIEIKSK